MDIIQCDLLERVLFQNEVLWEPGVSCLVNSRINTLRKQSCTLLDLGLSHAVCSLVLLRIHIIFS